MIRLSMNVISASLSLIKIIGAEEGTPYMDIHALYRVSDIDVDDLTDMLLYCGLLVRCSENLMLSKSGEKVLESIKNNYENTIRIMLSEYILYIEPVWSKRIPFGRFESTTFMTKDEKSCFYEAGLLCDEPPYDVILWWDQMSELIRKNVDISKTKIGRIGEQYTLEYEKERVGEKPIWKSIDSNLLGYDVMSRVSKEDNTPLLIEVKTSMEDIEHAYFHISANEWRVASCAKKTLVLFMEFR